MNCQDCQDFEDFQNCLTAGDSILHFPTFVRNSGFGLSVGAGVSPSE